MSCVANIIVIFLCYFIKTLAAACSPLTTTSAAVVTRKHCDPVRFMFNVTSLASVISVIYFTNMYFTLALCFSFSRRTLNGRFHFHEDKNMHDFSVCECFPGHVSPLQTHECYFLLELGRATCLTGTAPTGQVVVAVVVV